MKISKLFLGAGLLCFGLLLGTAGPASADSTCTTFNSANGATSFPGTYVGTVGSGGCQIGQLGLFDAASVSIFNDPSIYEFYFAGGDLTIQDQIGIGIVNVGVDLDSLSSLSSTSPTSTLASTILGPGSTGTLISGDNLAAGYYAIESYLTLDETTDPNYQINMTSSSVATPEPGSILLLAFGIAGLAFLRRRQAANELSM